jgi:hypothetical protein
MAKTYAQVRDEIDHILLLRIAHRLERKFWAEYQEYVEACEKDYSRGHAPSHCEHGTNLQTGYDNICGPCEEGWTMADGLQRRSRALALAHDRVDRRRLILDFVREASRLGIELTNAQISHLDQAYFELGF